MISAKNIGQKESSKWKWTRNPHNVNQLTGGGNANDGEEDVAKNNVVQEFIARHLLAR